MKNGIFIFLLSLVSQIVLADSIPVKAVHFYQEGEISKVEFVLDGEGASATKFHVAEDKQIIVDLKNTIGGERILRGMDTSEFNGSVIYINVYKKPGEENSLRAAIQLRDNVRSILTNGDNKITLSVENRFGVFSKNTLDKSGSTGDDVISSSELGKVNVPKTTSLNDILENLTMSGPKKYVGKRISLNVQNLPVIDILKMIAETSGFNIIIDQDVVKAAPLTLSLTNLPWDQILDTVLSLSKLTAKKKSNILMVTTLEKATAEKQAELQMSQLSVRQEPLVTKIFPISYAELASLTTILTPYLTQGRGTISSDTRTNVLIIKDTIETMERLGKIIDALDTQTPQILIESKIVEASESFRQAIGLANGISFGYDPVSQKSDLGYGTQATGPGFSFSTVSTGGSGGSGSTFLGLTVGLFKRIVDFNAQLQLLEQESKAKIVSSPKVITENNQPATLTSTETTSYQQRVADQTGSTITYATVSATLSLNVTPQVTNEGSIAMQVNIQKQGFGTRPSDEAPPNQSQRSVQTNVLVDNGSTIVLGGLYTVSKEEQVSGIPFLKDIPILGWLFRSAYAPNESKSELIIFLTPRIINQEEAGLVEREEPII